MKLFGVHLGGGPSGPEADLVRRYWSGMEEKPLPAVPPLGGTMLSSLCIGLGDTLMLTDVLKASKGKVPVFSASRHFRPLMKYNSWWTEPGPGKQLLMANAPALVRYCASGNGHYVQRLRRAFGLPVEPVPRASVVWSGKRVQNRVVMHFEAGPHALWQRKEITPKARTLYPESRAILEKWIANKRGMEFVMVGGVPREGPLKGVRTIRTQTLEQLVEVVAGCGTFIGIVSGIMHLATALQLRCITLLDFPHAGMVMLPTLKQVDQVESEWLYPQNVHLHQCEDGPLCRRLSAVHLDRALAGELYPFDRAAQYAEMIFEGERRERRSPGWDAYEQDDTTRVLESAAGSGGVGEAQAVAGA